MNFKIKRKKLNPNYPNGIPPLYQGDNILNVNYLWIKETPVAIAQLKLSILGKNIVSYKWDGFTWVAMGVNNHV